MTSLIRVLVTWRRASLAPTRLGWLIAGLVLSSCGQPNEQAVSVVARDTVGDTIVVRSSGPGAWGDGVELQLELRIGEPDRPPERTFGLISDIAVSSHGHLFVFDDYAPALREYDAQGEYLRTYGRFGSGPGEYRPNYLGIGVTPDGSVFQYDQGNSRINRYGPDGEYLDSRLALVGLVMTRSLRVDDRGEPYIRTFLRPRGSQDPGTYVLTGMVRVTRTGDLVDTLFTPPGEGLPRLRGSYEPGIVWDMSPRGFIVGGYNESYAVTLFRHDRPPLRIEREHEPVPIGDDERAELESRGTWLRRRIPAHQRQTTSDDHVSTVKPAYRDILTGEDGRIWVQRHVASVKRRWVRRAPDGRPPRTWIEPTVYDVFEETGEFLGSVSIPDEVTVYVVRDRTVWGVEEDDSGVQYVVRFRVLGS